ncbi:sirohydrochlorin chelatase [Anthocerotibacter panamensis]|uniref:sirohydrochlorin chelatase n=1 Tax=Anthocerotibacter panamensis TaxID=2857077 RepID=UPI001C401FF5|nr:sirohydrochlorin chelatase [Anthocerotibacter panamensis]
MEPPLIFLCAHGSRDPRAADQLTLLTQQVQDHLPYLVSSGVLEFGEKPLVEQLAAVVVQNPTAPLIVVPLFLLPGTHAREDLPQALHTLQQQFPKLTSTLAPPLSESPELSDALAQRIKNHPRALLFAHGSRRQGAEAPILDLAFQLSIRTNTPIEVVCHKSGEDILTHTLAHHPQGGLVLPLFLFDGYLVDYAREQVQSTLRWRSAEPLGKGDLLVPTIAQLVQQARAARPTPV